MAILLFFAFLSGIVTVSSPCIWPILPVVLSSTAASGRYRPFGMVLGIVGCFAVSMILFALLVDHTLIRRETLEYFAIGIILFFGLALLFPQLERWVERGISRLIPRAVAVRSTSRHGFWGGFILGGGLGVIWTPCAGPVLLAIASLIATETERGMGMVLIVAYAIGLALPLLGLSLLGQKILTHLRQFSAWTIVVRRTFGGIMILTALLVATDYHVVLQAKITGEYPVCSPLMRPLGENQFFLKALQTIP